MSPVKTLCSTSKGVCRLLGCCLSSTKGWYRPRSTEARRHIYCGGPSSPTDVVSETRRSRNPSVHRERFFWASEKAIRVTAQVFHSPVLFSLLFLVSLGAVLITPEREDKER
jgi:hypothetical protein